MDNEPFHKSDDDGGMPSEQEILDCRRAFNRRRLAPPDVDGAWQQFSEQHLSRRPRGLHFVWGFVAGIAATVALLLVWRSAGGDANDVRSLPVFEAIAHSDRVLLSASDGATHIITGSQRDSTLLAAGVAANSDSLVYGATDGNLPARQMTLVTPRGKDYFVTLSDGTRLWLNAGSRMVFPERFSGPKRVVELQGEAYFVVAPDSNHPFEVHTPFFTTTVLGTEFNLRAYAAADAHVVLVGGSVSLQKGTADTPIRLTPGHKAQWQPDGFSVEAVDTYSYTQWKEGFFYFDNAPLVEIMRELGRWYNVSITFNNPAAFDIRLHFVADRHSDLHMALDNLNILDVVHASLVDGVVILD